jgi:hypothetical protein
MADPLAGDRNVFRRPEYETVVRGAIHLWTVQPVAIPMAYHRQIAWNAEYLGEIGRTGLEILLDEELAAGRGAVGADAKLNRVAPDATTGGLGQYGP